MSIIFFKISQSVINVQYLTCELWLFYQFVIQYFLFTLSEPPQFIKEPEKHITAEMEKVVDIPCQARGELCVCGCSVHVQVCLYKYACILVQECQILIPFGILRNV